MKRAHLVACVALAGASHIQQTGEITGTLSGPLVGEHPMAVMELKLTHARDLPGLAAGDRVFMVRTPQFRPVGDRDGMFVAFVESKEGGFLFVDANLDDRLTESERTPYTPASDVASAPEVSLEVLPTTSGAAPLPFRCRLVSEEWEGSHRYHLHFTASFRVEGHADVGGRRTLVSLPFSSVRGATDIRNGKIGIDANGDGRVDLRGLSGPEVMFARGDRVILRVGDRYLSVESADFATRTFVLKEHAAEEYAYIEVAAGAALPDFAFTDFSGRVRRLSEFRGKYVLLDFWGSWCAPCLADVPLLKTAYERFRGRGFEIVGIDYEYTATSDKVRALLEEKNITWPNAMPESVKELVEKRFRIWGFPTLILIDRNGVVVETNAHTLRGDALLSTLERLLQEPSDPMARVSVEAQPLAANVQRLIDALEYLGAPLPADVRASLAAAGRDRDANRLQELLDPHVLLAVHLNPEARVKVARGPAAAWLQQAGYTPVIVKIVNESRGTQRLRIASPQAGPVYAGMSRLSGERMQQQHLRENENTEGRTDRFLDVEMFSASPMTATLSGLDVEYALALIYASEAGRREATIAFDAGQGTEDLGFRAEVPVLFTVKPAIAVELGVLDHDGTPTTARFQFVDRLGHVFPPQAKRLAPDFFFQKHIYRSDGETVLLPPGELTMFYGRGPEYRWIKRTIVVPAPGSPGPVNESSARTAVTVRLDRWIDPAARGYYSGDHHIHAAGCAHYTSPTQGVDPADMFRQVKGEGLNVGSVLTWGPGFDHQQQFFAPDADRRSEPLTVMKYDIEVSGFGSEALGHVVLLDLKEQIYPGARGSKGWPTWTLPVLRWVKAQGGIGGYAHSGSGLDVNPAAATTRLLDQLDANRDRRLDPAESALGLLPESLEQIDTNGDRLLSEHELKASHDRVQDELPNFAVPELNSVGAQEIFVTAAHRVADFISAMDTDRIREWNAWYHLMNVGLPVKASGETDFPCMSGTRVGQGRSYVQLGKQTRVDYPQWCRGIARGRSYVSDGYAHAFDFDVNGRTSGDELDMPSPGLVRVEANVAFSPETPLEPAYGTVIPVGGRRHVGDTIVVRETQAADPGHERRQRLVELVVNGRVAASREVPADGREHAVEFSVAIERSSWVALRQFPQLHTNPVYVLVGGKPIRASRKSAQWAIACIDQLWRVRSGRIAPNERTEAEQAYEAAREVYRRAAAESPPEK